MKLASRFDTFYLGFLFVFTFLLVIPFLLILSQRISWHQAALRLHTWWARIYMLLAALRIEIDWQHRPRPGERYVLCANHFSYFDIPILAYLPLEFKFIGKSSISKVPLFGYMYRKLHVTVNRSSFRDRAQSMKRVREMVDYGFNIAFFPEGGIRTKNPPQMVPFKEGAFRISVEKQIPIMPLTIADNFKFLPDEDGFRVYRRKLRITVHRPIMPKSDSEKEINVLKAETFDVIQTELNRLHGID